MESVFGDMDKIIIDKDSGQGVLPYLPLPEISKKKVE
jgi:membrane protease subunit HflK